MLRFLNSLEGVTIRNDSELNQKEWSQLRLQALQSLGDLSQFIKTQREALDQVGSGRSRAVRVQLSREERGYLLSEISKVLATFGEKRFYPSLDAVIINNYDKVNDLFNAHPQELVLTALKEWFGIPYVQSVFKKVSQYSLIDLSRLREISPDLDNNLIESYIETNSVKRVAKKFNVPIDILEAFLFTRGKLTYQLNSKYEQLVKARWYFHQLRYRNSEVAEVERPRLVQNQPKSYPTIIELARSYIENPELSLKKRSQSLNLNNVQLTVLQLVFRFTEEVQSRLKSISADKISEEQLSDLVDSLISRAAPSFPNFTIETWTS
jgi:hypothetical protein